ncbi:AAA family ATPase [Actinomadura geliboluensis]
MPRILPYSLLVGQERLCRCLEIAFVSPQVGGVLITGERGTAKSTAVRSFSLMAHGRLPVTLPINATDDRVLGGWRVEALLEGRHERQPGLLEQAGQAGLLYVDEVNLLDDYLVNIILDVASTGVLEVQREGLDRSLTAVTFTLAGTMNPEEGGLRPQLLDRFGLLVPVTAESAPQQRRLILDTVLRFEAESAAGRSGWLAEAEAADTERRELLLRARAACPGVDLPENIRDLCARIAGEFRLAGHRGELNLCHGAQAVAALDGRDQAVPEDVRVVAPHALVHRIPDAAYGDDISWTDKDQERLDALIP